MPLTSRGNAISILLAKKLSSSFVEFLAVTANPLHQLAGLLYGDVVLPGEVVNIIGLVQSTPPKANPFRLLLDFRSQSRVPAYIGQDRPTTELG
jgi:hypothetical protein